jgi:DNA-binding NarL/FixJ family response regulator
MNTTTQTQTSVETTESHETISRRKPTPRELQALSLVARGLDSKTVAARMKISKRTVDFHLANIYTKLDANNRVQAINNARAKGYL